MLKTVVLLHMSCVCIILLSIHNVSKSFYLYSVLISEGQTEPHPRSQTESSGTRQLFDSGGGFHGFYCDGVGDVGGSVLLAPSLPP